ncbi:hypothetical protein HLV37_05805 [Eggerthellaceae bacterium zg-1084]|uniref:Uncharacterized protein n=1 Tax=Berryella wangjianweii TaxID=2734634 RepID=A0A6M8J2P8_9ACTN|nr:hypothetical protein [Berryella wangjianweii]NPD31377.1 hypothetical protein [Berryella wangjianweii]NPD32316.1 hypothetical protein [Eggerthellaceae bacterium zg-997]QKF06913.1 hypothetical protein HLV38_01330 [Berryella wangjianweii]
MFGLNGLGVSEAVEAFLNGSMSSPLFFVALVVVRVALSAPFAWAAERKGYRYLPFLLTGAFLMWLPTAIIAVSLPALPGSTAHRKRCPTWSQD